MKEELKEGVKKAIKECKGTDSEKREAINLLNQVDVQEKNWKKLINRKNKTIVKINKKFGMDLKTTKYGR